MTAEFLIFDSETIARSLIRSMRLPQTAESMVAFEFCRRCLTQKGFWDSKFTPKVVSLSSWTYFPVYHLEYRLVFQKMFCEAQAFIRH